MNRPEPNLEDDLPADEALADALLAEHARLGSKNDEALIESILLNTINQPIEVDFSPVVPQDSPKMGLSDWAKIAAAVVVFAGLGILVLNSLKTEKKAPFVAEDQRTEDVFHVIVKSPDTTESANKPAQRKVELSIASSKEMEVDTKDSLSNGVAYELAFSDLGEDVTLGKEFEHSLAIDQIARPSFTLAANETVKTEGKVIYSGEVLLSHEDFVIEADSVAMSTAASEGGYVKALNARLSHRDKAIQTSADSISFDPATGSLVVRGLREFLKGGQAQEFGKSSVLLLDPDQVSVEG